MHTGTTPDSFMLAPSSVDAVSIQPAALQGNVFEPSLFLASDEIWQRLCIDGALHKLSQVPLGMPTGAIWVPVCLPQGSGSPLWGSARATAGRSVANGGCSSNLQCKHGRHGLTESSFGPGTCHITRAHNCCCGLCPSTFSSVLSNKHDLFDEAAFMLLCGCLAAFPSPIQGPVVTVHAKWEPLFEVSSSRSRVLIIWEGIGNVLWAKEEAGVRPWFRVHKTGACALHFCVRLWASGVLRLQIQKMGTQVGRSQLSAAESNCLVQRSLRRKFSQTFPLHCVVALHAPAATRSPQLGRLCK